MTIEQIYEKGTAEQLWNAWNEKQRINFLQDHDAIINKMSKKAGFENPKRTPRQLKDVLTEFAGEKFNNLHGVIQKAIAAHHTGGFYYEGGRIGITKTKSSMKYLTPNKKQLLSTMNSLRENMKKEKDPKIFESINLYLQKMESILNAKTSTRDKISKWKQQKAKKLTRK